MQHKNYRLALIVGVTKQGQGHCPGLQPRDQVYTGPVQKVQHFRFLK